MRWRLVVVGLALVWTAGFSMVALAGVTGSAHDLTVSFPATNACEYCHAPHNPTPGDSPLWNHMNTIQTFTMYGTTMLGTAPDPVPNAPSLRCLGCHDGITAIDAYGGRAGTTIMTGDSVIGTNLSNDHPVSIHYDPNLVGAGLDCVKCHTFGAGNPDIVFYDQKTECPSCHDPHKTTYAKFLRASVEAGELCLICHNK